MTPSPAGVVPDVVRAALPVDAVLDVVDRVDAAR